MKQFELTLVRHNTMPGEFKILSLDKIEADDLVQLMTQFALLIAVITRKLSEEAVEKMANEVSLRDDDIPF